ncbi:hypothetical protein K435DRAFT_873144 [Dendrothele bispora CBS 962.96]|uniref:PLP-dependent transferase n=1 Tax=Dendrothele bispora (strain CBS 962.96) TaxID=1314807 RepID=A0A4S8KZV0_DENBC|nr:hypothetical protein K435DRAFT_873144 [Dendrothele bispora CBS 962.96]
MISARNVDSSLLLMVAVEFNSPPAGGRGWDPVYQNQKDTGKQIPKGLASLVAKKCIEKGMLLLTTSVYEVVRFIPALNIGREDVQRGVGIFEETLREVVGEWELEREGGGK